MTRARHPTHNQKHLGCRMLKKKNQKPLRGRAKRHSVTRNKRGGGEENGKRFFSSVSVYAGALVMMMVTHTKRKSLGNYQEKKL